MRGADLEPTDELATLLDDPHDSEINGGISWFYDGVRQAKIGDPLSGYKAEGRLHSLRDVTPTQPDRYPSFQKRGWRTY
jgi:hypothetical protein